MENNPQVEINYRGAYMRPKLFNSRFFDSLYHFCSYPRLMLEVFVKKDFGERYLTKTACAHVAIFLLAFPLVWTKCQNFYYTHIDKEGTYYGMLYGLVIFYTTWYLFTVFFLIAVWRRQREMKRSPTMYDFSKFSYSLGITKAFVYKIRLPFIKPTSRNIEMIYEPAIFYLLGFVLWALSQPIGTLLLLCSVMYSISHYLGYKSSRETMLDRIDSIQENTDLRETFSEGNKGTDSDEFSMRKPKGGPTRGNGSPDSEPPGSGTFAV